MPVSRPGSWAVAMLVVGSCARNPVTGRQELSLISEAQEIQLGAEAAERAIASIGLVEDAPLQAYVERVGLALAQDSHRPDLPWAFHVLDDPTPNAFALPGGTIFITRGMMAWMDSEAELAAVLGHEIGHVAAKHQVRRISEAQVAQVGFGVGSILFPEVRGLGGVLGVGLELLFLEYSRDDEREADQLGLHYALDARYDVLEMDDIFVSLARLEARSGRSPLPTWASTHPAIEERIATIRRVQQRTPPPVDTPIVGRASYLGQIDGLAFGDDPREGYFEGRTFYHPELAFQITFPAGWETENLPQVVVGATPQRDAVVQLEPIAGTPRQAAQTFAAAPGVSAGPSSDLAIHGRPAVLASFRAQADRGPIEGLAGFVGHGAQTYAILGYAPSGRAATYDPTFREVIQSFAPVTDPSVLHARTARLDVVRLDRAMTVEQFARAHGASASLEDILLLNQLADPATVLPAGTQVKGVSRDAPSS